MSAVIQKHAMEGLAVALASPFDARQELDERAYRALVGHVAEGGAQVLVVCGTTGEAPTLSAGEREKLVRWTIEESRGLPVVVGTGSNATRATCEWTAAAQEWGAHGALVVVPYYNKPGPDGVCEHFRHVAQAAPDWPLWVYNVPGRTGLNLEPSTLMRLWEIDSVVAVKESSGDLAQISNILAHLPPGKTVFAGDDHLALASIALGAKGLVSVVGNVFPRETAQMVRWAVEGEIAQARTLHERLMPMVEALFCEPNPIPLKAALAQMGMAEEHARLPLTSATDATHARIRAAMHAFTR